MSTEFSTLIGSTSFNNGQEKGSPTEGEEAPELRPKPGSRRSRKASEAKSAAHSDNCLERVLHCLSHVPCGSLVAWIALLLGLGGVTGGVLIGTLRTRDLLENDRTLWFMEYTLIGVMSGMFVIGTLLLILGHYSSDPNSRHCFNTSRKNACARGCNIVMLVLSYILLLAWILVSGILVIPVGLLGLVICLKNYQDDFDCIDLSHYGFQSRKICGEDLERFVNQSWDLLICYVAAYFSAVIVIVSLIHFLMCISANVTHLRDARFATLNAYEEAEEAQNTKHNVNDTTM